MNKMNERKNKLYNCFVNTLQIRRCIGRKILLIYLVGRSISKCSYNIFLPCVKEYIYKVNMMPKCQRHLSILYVRSSDAFRFNSGSSTRCGGCFLFSFLLWEAEFVKVVFPFAYVLESNFLIYCTICQLKRYYSCIYTTQG